MLQERDAHRVPIVGKQVPNDKLVKHRIIFQGLVNGKRKLKELVMNFCSGECAMNEQCSREG